MRKQAVQCHLRYGDGEMEGKLRRQFECGVHMDALGGERNMRADQDNRN